MNLLLLLNTRLSEALVSGTASNFNATCCSLESRELLTDKPTVSDDENRTDIWTLNK